MAQMRPASGSLHASAGSDAGHMRSDLDGLDFRLEPEDVERIERLASR
jgi:hypothetical protein